MKKMIYLLLLLLLVNPCFAFQNADLSCKVRKGDQWKMVFELFTNIDHTVNALDTLMKGRFTIGSGHLTALSEWQVECKESADTSIELKFTLTQIRFYEKRNIRDSDALYYNDTDYPVDLSDEYVTEINNILGRSFTCRFDMQNKSSTEIITDEFENKELRFPGRNFMTQNASFLVNIYFRYNIYNIIGPDFVRIVLDSWNAIIPKEDKNVGDVWAPSGLIADKNQDSHVVFEKHSGNFAYLKLSGKDDNDMMLIHKKSGLPFVIMTPDFKAYVYDFKDIANTTITGKFTEGDLNGTAVLKSEAAGYEINETVQVKNGFFEIPLNLKQPVICTLTFNSKTFYLFLTPGMQVQLNWDESNKKPVVEGFGANDVQCVLEFWDEKYYMYHYETSKFPYELIIEKRDEYKKRVGIILKKYKGLISNECRNFIETESNFRIAISYTVARQDVEREKALEKNLDVTRANKNASYFENFNDSLPLIGDVTNYSPAYNVFIDRNLELKNRIFLAQRGRRYERDNVRENLYFAALHYVGYPYYYSAFMLLKSEILKGNQEDITKELDEFIKLPGNPSFSNTLQQLIQEMEIIKEGNAFPFPEIVDMENNKVEIPKGHFAIVDINNSFYLRSPQHQEELEELTRIIKEDSQLEKINYVVIRPDFAKGKMTESVSTEFVNFLYIYLPEHDRTVFEKIRLIEDRSRILLLNKDRMIIDNNIGKIGHYTGHNLPEIIDEYLNSPDTPPAKSEIPWLFIVGSLTLFGILSWLVIRIRTERIKKREEARRKLSELELKAIRSQMNPHFIFNAMGSIQNLINQNDIKNANLYLSRFARLMRMVLANSNKKLVNLADELELLKNYLELEQLRVDFQYTISLSENIDPENEEIPGMLVQPFVENAVIHGITPKGHGMINVHFTKESGVLTCIVEDDGVGIDVSENGNGQGLAMKLSEKRLNLLNSQSNEKLHLKVENRNGNMNNGTKITLMIPV